MSPTTWWARGLLFENCNCQVVCPGHVHFDQLCTHERCKGYWAMRFEDGEFNGISLAGVRAVVVYDSPRHMIDGGWVEGLIVDSGASEAQRAAVEGILKGAAGGPWEKLARFVGRWLPTRFVPIRIEESDGTKRVAIDGLLASTLEPIRGRDRSQPVTVENMFNQIHAPSQVVARGSTRYDDAEIVVVTDKTHGLWSRFDWAVMGR
jgi:hypothetical protein